MWCGSIALVMQSLSWYGLCDQLRLNSRRRSVAGVSILDSECRTWGKVPWIWYACTFPTADLALLLANGVGLALSAALLAQHGRFHCGHTRMARVRVLSGLSLLAGSLVLLFLFHGQARALRHFIQPLPAALTVLSVVLGGTDQFLLNRRSRQTDPLSTKRYLIAAGTSSVWLCYGLTAYSLAEAWPLCVSCAVALAMNLLILLQIRSFTTASTPERYGLAEAIP
jgi:uncharacterized protein with PQ loop repeat